MHRAFILFASIAGCTGVAMGAFAAHALKNHLSPDRLAVLSTATQYQLLHAVALLAVASSLRALPRRLGKLAGCSFALGIVLFSGSLYALALTGIRAFGAVTPVGGLAFLVGWAALGLAAWR
jgi:uncharacterized membrane protein YgdD (TMEM256/DUF423 family)